MANGSNITALAKSISMAGKAHVKVQTCWAVADEVNWEEKTMTATAVIDGLPYFGIQLGTGTLYRRPAIGSMCLLGLIENQDGAAFLIDAEQLEETICTVGASSLITMADGFILKQGDESFKDVVNDLQTEIGKLCDELNKVVVSIGKGPNILAITAIKEKVTGNIADRFNSIFIA